MEMLADLDAGLALLAPERETVHGTSDAPVLPT